MKKRKNCSTEMLIQRIAQLPINNELKSSPSLILNVYCLLTWEEVYGVVVERGGDRSHSEGDERHEDLQEGEGGPELLRTEQDGELGPDNDRLHSS